MVNEIGLKRVNLGVPGLGNLSGLFFIGKKWDKSPYFSGTV